MYNGFKAVFIKNISYYFIWMDIGMLSLMVNGYCDNRLGSFWRKI